MEFPHNRSATGTLVFLKRLDKYDVEKPYCIHALTSAIPGGKTKNEEDEKVEVSIQNLRHQCHGSRHAPSMQLSTRFS